MNRKDEFLEQVAVIDFETTDRDYTVAEVIEYGIAIKRGGWAWDTFSQLCKPSISISPEISAVTNITDEMVEGEPSFEDEVDALLKSTDKLEYFVAHNSFYDDQVLQRYTDKGKPWICTMRMAKKLFIHDPESVTQYNLPYLRYRFKLPVQDNGLAHRAGFDARVTGLLLEFLIEEMENRDLLEQDHRYDEQILNWIEEPIIYEYMPYGKQHKGKKLEDVPMSYWNWALNKMDLLDENSPSFDRDFAASVEKVLEDKLG